MSIQSTLTIDTNRNFVCFINFFSYKFTYDFSNITDGNLNVI